MPPGQEVASFATYPEAQHAVDMLSDEGFPVEHLAIVGTDLRQVENITGRMSWGRAIISGSVCSSVRCWRWWAPARWEARR